MKKILIITIFISLCWSGIHFSLASDNKNENKKNPVISLQENVEFLDALREKRKKEISAKIKLIRKQRIIAQFNARQQIEQDLVFSSADNIEYKHDLDIFEEMKYNRIQEKSLSCELSATSDIISHLENRKISETSIINMVDKSMYNQLPIIENGKTIWGNPNAGYVGNIHEISEWVKATQTGMTGYWVLEKPIAKIFDTFNYKNKIITRESYNEVYSQVDHLTELLKNINAGNMIQLWWDYCTNPEFEDTENTNSCSRFGKDRKLEWYYKENWELKSYTGLAWEHAFYLLGYKWGVQNPTDIIVWDTQTWKHTFPISEWLRKWNAMDNKSIIIYKKYN